MPRPTTTDRTDAAQDSGPSKPPRAGLFYLSGCRAIVEKLEEAKRVHELVRTQVAKASEELFEQRQQAVTSVIRRVEALVNGLANTPREFDSKVRAFRAKADRFEANVEHLKREIASARKIGGGVGLTGAAAGVGVAVLGPTAALGVATTFGTASTGTAISALSGAAATKAAVAWIGGGALVKGGGGMLAGRALLALAGPVGWTLGGVTLMGSGAYVLWRNRRSARRATEQLVSVEGETHSLRVALREIEGLEGATREISDRARALLDSLAGRTPRAYRDFSVEQKQRLAALINDAHSLGRRIRKEAC